ncbi:putative at hook domain-containing protein [Erysiphe necator]|uniref:Putative at hook domain-containing protein n=1 Tax=Uncinula necator TaxID=52586 RepID=A0A0B1P6M9_UNCNE|nr:putative at hook domain-containing protein [Erysiphe necator]
MASHDHLQAQFLPISPEFDLDSFAQSSDNINYVSRLSKEILNEHSAGSIEALVFAVVIKGGRPLVIEGWEPCLPSSLYSRQWLECNHGHKVESVRDISNEANISMTIGHYLRSMGKLTQQFTALNYMESKHQRLYLKDIDCPEAWACHLKSVIPESIFYLNECIRDANIDSSSSFELNHNGRTYTHKGITPAGDLMSSLPSEMQALNFMCYVGHEGTYTAAHREMCATIGHNIMVEASKDFGDEIEGSSIWFMTETKEREDILDYFSAVLGHDVDVEKHFAQINAWKKAPFKVWVVEQKVGDLVIIPPLAPHQVWNRGTRTIKVAWNRTTVDTLELALHESLSNYRMVCREEQYKCKAIVYYTLQKYYQILLHNKINKNIWQHGRTKQLLDEFRRLFYLYQEMLLSEMLSEFSEEKKIEMLPFDSGVTCSYCRCNIFNRFLTCKACSSDDLGVAGDTFDICMDCYVMGRSCVCISNLSWVEQWDWKTLIDQYNLWREYLIGFYNSGDISRYPESLDDAKKTFGKKTLAEICQEQLKIRPIRKLQNSGGPRYIFNNSDSKARQEIKPKCTKRRRKPKSNISKNKNTELEIANKSRCHFCNRQDWNWKMAFCSSCCLAFCYNVLWLKFDLMPQIVMADNKWRCPRCLNICSCKNCQKISVQKPYQPKKMLLGHNTKKVADFRSVESLIDFSRSKLICLSDDTDNSQEYMHNKRLKRISNDGESEESASFVEYPESNFAPFEKTINLTSGYTNCIDPYLCNLSTTVPSQKSRSSMKTDEI